MPREYAITITELSIFLQMYLRNATFTCLRTKNTTPFHSNPFRMQTHTHTHTSAYMTTAKCRKKRENKSRTHKRKAHQAFRAFICSPNKMNYSREISGIFRKMHHTQNCRLSLYATRSHTISPLLLLSRHHFALSILSALQPVPPPLPSFHVFYLCRMHLWPSKVQLHTVCVCVPRFLLLSSDLFSLLLFRFARAFYGFENRHIHLSVNSMWMLDAACVCVFFWGSHTRPGTNFSLAMAMHSSSVQCLH